MREQTERRPWAWSMLWLAALASFFFLSYGFANHVTAWRVHVPSLVFAWESRIPFLPWTIVPYWSTDLFYAVSLFLCRTRAELNTHAKRLLAVQLICVAGFLLFPLRFSFARPAVPGLFGGMFAVLMGFDKPFNQAPSLHVALTAVLWRKYGQHLRGPAPWLTRGWFTLMALSTLTTWQHHFIDVPTGLWVGLLVLVAIPDSACGPHPDEASRDPRRYRIAACYLAGALLCAAVAIRIGGAVLLLLWPAESLAIVGVIYLSGRAELFRKRDGSMPAAMVALLAPNIAGARLNALCWTRRDSAADEIVPGVWLGRLPRRRERDSFAIASMVDLTDEFPVNKSGLVYRGVPMLDLLAPGAAQLSAAVSAIEELGTARPTLVCCALGYSRSASAMAAWLVAGGRADSVDRAIEQIRGQRPRIAIRPAVRAAIERWAESRRRLVA